MILNSVTVLFLQCLVWSVQAPGAIGNSNNHHKLSTSTGEQIPKEFYFSMDNSNTFKLNLQRKLLHFLENIQRNLTISTVFSTFQNDTPNAAKYMHRLQELSMFFYEASQSVENFSIESEKFFEIIKVTSNLLLLKLRQVPKAQPTHVKLLLTNYFSEMEFFHILLSEVVDEALEYTTTILQTIKKLFFSYANIQNDILNNWKLKIDLDCCKLYADFLHHHSARLFKCATADKLQIAFDMYSVTKINAKYIVKQLEFRIQRLLNCINFGSFSIRCQFLNNAEGDFENLFNKLSELELYLNIKIKKSGISVTKMENTHDSVNRDLQLPTPNSFGQSCLLNNFPYNQMSKQLKECFYFFNSQLK
ncbi:hypothetical protein KR026_000500 [Drosophila bipectinata]|nr:hypothetical protein KR026_000500 [Drosophila bipectinata]